jgi:hypothetical protein
MYLLFFLINIFSCEYLVLKRGEKLPYKIKPGKYEIFVNKLDYEPNLFYKQNFFDIAIKKFAEIIKKREKYILMLPEIFAIDINCIKEHGAIYEELPFFKVASQLSDEDVLNLCKLMNIDSKKKYSIQTLLNFQVKYLLGLLNRTKDYDSNKVYTELFKREIISSIMIKRSAIIKALNNQYIEIVINIDNPYKKDLKNINRDSSYLKDIDFRSSNIFSKSLDDYRDKMIFISNIEYKDLEKIISGDLPISLKRFTVIQDKYIGYILSDSLIYMVGGKEKIYSNRDFKIDISIIEKNNNINELDNIVKTNVLFKDL